MQLRTAVALFLDGRRAANRSPRTVAWYATELEHFITWLEVGGFAGWYRPEIVERYLVEELKRGLAPATVHGRYRAINAFCRWLMRRRMVPSDLPVPTDLVTPPQVPAREPVHVELSEYVRLLASIGRSVWIDQRDRLLVTTLFLTGIRRGELVALQPSDYNLPLARLTIRVGKGGSGRYVPLLPAIAQEYAAFMLMRPATHYLEVFLAADGYDGVRGVLTGNGVHQRLRVLCERAGVRRLNAHAFRHGLAMYLLNTKRADMSLIQQILGHQRVTTTAEIYARWQFDGVRTAYAQLMET